jgi:hypothetical protein
MAVGAGAGAATAGAGIARGRRRLFNLRYQLRRLAVELAALFVRL